MCETRCTRRITHTRRACDIRARRRYERGGPFPGSAATPVNGEPPHLRGITGPRAVSDYLCYVQKRRNEKRTVHFYSYYTWYRSTVLSVPFFQISRQCDNNELAIGYYTSYDNNNDFFFYQILLFYYYLDWVSTPTYLLTF